MTGYIRSALATVLMSVLLGVFAAPMMGDLMPRPDPVVHYGAKVPTAGTLAKRAEIHEWIEAGTLEMTERGRGIVLIAAAAVVAMAALIWLTWCILDLFAQAVLIAIGGAFVSMEFLGRLAAGVVMPGTSRAP